METGFALSEIDTATPHPARIYDALLGGKDNYAADRQAVRQLLKAAPEARDSARANRAFLQRAVRFLAGEAGIRQFIDVGTGIPAAGNVHEVARGRPGGLRGQRPFQVWLCTRTLIPLGCLPRVARLRRAPNACLRTRWQMPLFTFQERLTLLLLGTFS